MFRSSMALALASILFFYSQCILAEAADVKLSFADYVGQLKQQAIEDGFKKPFVEQTFKQIKLFKRATASDTSQPEERQTLETYLPQVVPKWKVDKARKLYKTHYSELKRIGDKYGIQPRFIVALWGVESNFGALTGNYPVLSVTASLAFEGRREAFFKEEFFAALKIIKQQDITFSDLKGSWAGAMGQTQFMPSSYLAYAQDGDSDGVKDIWTSTSDAFASAAFYLQEAGWNKEQTWGRQVKVQKGFEQAVVGIQQKKSLVQWQELGVRRYNGTNLPAIANMQASLIAPDGEKGRYYLVYDNYRSLLRWNRSNYFAITVAYLSEKIKSPKIKLD